MKKYAIQIERFLFLQQTIYNRQHALSKIAQFEYQAQANRIA